MAETIASMLLTQLGQHPAFARQVWTTGCLLGRRVPDKQLEHFEQTLIQATYQDQRCVTAALIERKDWRTSLNSRIDALRAAEGAPGLADDILGLIPHITLHEYARTCCELGLSQIQAILPLVEKGLYWSMVQGELCVSTRGAERTLRMYALMVPSTH